MENSEEKIELFAIISGRVPCDLYRVGLGTISQAKNIIRDLKDRYPEDEIYLVRLDMIN